MLNTSWFQREATTFPCSPLTCALVTEADLVSLALLDTESFVYSAPVNSLLTYAEMYDRLAGGWERLSR